MCILKSYGGEKMVNANELKAAMVRKGFTQKQVAERLNITPRTLSKKLHRGIFGSDEIESLMSILDIDDPVPIFFDQSVTYKVTTKKGVQI